MAVWLVLLAGYCALQTWANGISVELQDNLLFAMPLFAAVASVAGLRAGPALPLIARIGIGGAAAVLFGALYFQYFRWVIVKTLHIWDRDEGLLGYLANAVGFINGIGLPLGMIGGGWLGAAKVRRSQSSEPADQPEKL
ncbi:MAG TPA: hypothetical protein VGO52_03595 [Hyphomonadaceae bacterium]|nr:hypothetical protein [Hyphomonadaceae bacterium]